MNIWVDADACPVAIREILFRAADRARVMVTLVANRTVRVPRSPFIRSLQVMPGFDVADNEIARRAEAGDIVVTADIPLAAEVMEKGAHALNPRGELYSPDTIRQRLNMRDFMDTLRASGIQSGGPPAMGQAERKAFANHLDALLAKRKQGES
ncbi:MAG TPA: YaiI/YqxD family protein [Gammaproteobacteria bacterium]|nr:YaiI/YqxD family protein [Gammaproteobacteria bacterium]